MGSYGRWVAPKVLDLTSGAGAASPLRLEELGRESVAWSGGRGSEAQQAAPHPSPARHILHVPDPFSEPHFPHLGNGAKSNVSSEAGGGSCSFLP